MPNDKPVTFLTKEEWIKRCAAHYGKVTDIDEETANSFADACFDMYPEMLPENAAEEDINCWSE
jgi:hypothetical protein